MKVVILAGGYGSRLSEETEKKPKPMVEIGGMPIIWHIMKIYFSYGFNDFIICAGYNYHIIKNYFQKYSLNESNITSTITNKNKKKNEKEIDSWKIKIVNTGLDTMTGGRLKRVYDYIKGEDLFSFTYGDGLGNINIKNLVNFHKKHGKKATVTATHPKPRFGAIKLGHNNQVKYFEEKPLDENSWINGGFFILHPDVIKYIKDDQTSWEKEPLNNLTKDGELFAYKHDGFWMPMDTLRDKKELNNIWNKNIAPWKIW